jgi:hypothetical protein
MFIDIYVKYPLFFPHLKILNFLDTFSKNTLISNILVRAELLHANGWTYGQPEMMKLIVAIRNFANTPNKNRKCEGIRYNELKFVLNFILFYLHTHENFVRVQYFVLIN